MTQHSSSAHDHDHAHGGCRRYLGSLSDYVDGVLAEELCHEIEAHMAECENCRVVVNTLSKTVLLYQQLPQPDVPSDVKERLFKVLDIRPFVAPPADSGDSETSPTGV